MKSPMLCAIQMVSGQSVANNLERASTLIHQAVQGGANFIVLPEFFAVIASADERLAVSEPFMEKPEAATPIQYWLAQSALKHKIWLIGGSVPIHTPIAGKIANAQLVYNPQGEWVSRYDKIHLFNFDNGAEKYDEHQFIVEGDSTQTLSFLAEGVSVAHGICYDLRFPEHFRHFSAPAPQRRGHDVVLMPAAFTHTTGQAHWEILCRARAIENQAFMVAAAQGGVHDNGRRTWGHSMIIDPWGNVLDELPEGEGFVMAPFSAERIQEVRRQLPALAHRRLW